MSDEPFDLGKYPTTGKISDAVDAAVRRDINTRALAGEWLTSHESLLSAFSYSAFERTLFKRHARLTPSALSAARAAVAKLSPQGDGETG